MGESVEERFWRYVYKTPNCWFWIGSLSKGIYGVMRRNDSRGYVGAHVISWELHNHRRTVPPEHICHTCDTPQCVNPEHLFVSTKKGNAQDAAAKGMLGVHKSFWETCSQGHPFTGIDRLGKRYCKVCHYAHLKYRRRVKQLAAQASRMTNGLSTQWVCKDPKPPEVQSEAAKNRTEPRS